MNGKFIPMIVPGFWLSGIAWWISYTIAVDKLLKYKVRYDIRFRKKWYYARILYQEYCLNMMRRAKSWISECSFGYHIPKQEGDP
jgi:hypothetical protein